MRRLYDSYFCKYIIIFELTFNVHLLMCEITYIVYMLYTRICTCLCVRVYLRKNTKFLIIKII